MVAQSARADIEKQLHELQKTRSCVDPSEITGVIESVIVSIREYRAKLSVKLYDDIEALANYIGNAKSEIAAIKADEINSEQVPAATDELTAIVGATEQATNEIFEAVETIEELTSKMEPAIAEKVTDAVTRVYEACSFQDITGQRVTKVVTTLQSIETKVLALLAALGEDYEAVGSDTVREAAKTPDGSDESLLNGPQMPEDAISQGDVDALLANFD